MEIYISIFLYLITFGLCIWLDLKPNSSKKFRVFFVVWLYIFLCFGYMTGSDWRSYEPEYGGFPMFYPITESVFYYCFFWISKVIPDYWLAVGLLKMLYLHSFFMVVKSYTDKYLFVSAVVFQTLLFMIIDNPLRYMLALTFVNFGLYFYNTKRPFYFWIFLSISVLFHNSSIVFLALLYFFLQLSPKLCKVKNWVLAVAYIAIMVLVSNADMLNQYFSQIMVVLGGVGFKDYTTAYSIENNDGLFVLGNLIKSFFFFVFLFTRKKVLESNPQNALIIGMTIVYFFMDKAFVVVPTGFRLVIPYGIFFALYCVQLLYVYRRIAYIFVLFLTLQLAKNVYNAWIYIPYSNSIPYILSEHKSFEERDSYNLNWYYKRNGVYPE